MGLSPQVRGNLGRAGRGGLPEWSIPAGAGEPLAAVGAWLAETGLSPQVRGNPSPCAAGRGRARSIPAGAGEPPASQSRTRPFRVYPRRCGGTRSRPASSPASHGLSPQVRGNPRRMRGIAHVPGSIPAGAGEPTPLSLAGARIGVYPRRCGGTEFPVEHRLPFPGLSPQVRGNPDHQAGDCADAGSIPAGAGEPSPPGSTLPRCRVYPRRCGGTGLALLGTKRPAGLSPQVRGNRRSGEVGREGPGSIPAGAGEP